jgi:hypothetical protein
MRTNLATMGVVNPYALAELAIGRRVNWSRVAHPHTVIETALGMPWDLIINPASGSILYAGLVLGTGGPKWLPAVEVATDIERRLLAHRAFTPTTMPTRVSPSMQRLLSRPNDLALQRFRLAVQQSMGSGGSDTSVQWVDEGMFFTDAAADEGDPVQGGLGDCYFIAALDAVAWSVPAMLKWFPFVDFSNPQGPPDPTGPGSIRFSPGYYHSLAASDVVTTGPLWEGVTMTELLPESPEGVPLYATSSDAGETWPGLYEKAFAIWRTGSSDRPDYKPLGGGWCGGATQALVGRDWRLDSWANESLTAADVLHLVLQHTRNGQTFHPMTAFTYSDETSFPQDGIPRDYTGSDIIYNHCYSLLGWLPLGGIDYIVVRNPWGQDESTRTDRAPDGTFAGIALNTNGVFGLPVEVFRLYYEGFAVVYP